MEFFLIIALIGVVFYLLRYQILAWLLRRVGMPNIFKNPPQPKGKAPKQSPQRSSGEKVDITQIDMRKFDKDQGEYVDFTEEKNSTSEQ